MKKWTEILLVFVFGLIFPLVALSAAPQPPGPEETQPATTAETIDSTEETELQRKVTLPIYLSDGSVAEMELDTYLTGVVLGEMPADFEMEALKAQAVVARTYTLRRHTQADKHPGGGVCTNSTCCQAYRDPVEYLSSGGTQESLEKITSAVTATCGQVLTYNGALIEATYFSCSGGRTEDAVAVWGSDLPYLQAVDSPGEERAPRYTETLRFSQMEFASKLGQSLSGNWLGTITYTDGGGVATIQIGDKTYQGTELRQILGLRSTAFVITAVGDTVTVTTKGFGHRVGMSQYGADAMAVGGSTYGQILAHYYQGTALETWQG